MDSVESYIEENGIESVLREIEDIKNHNVKFHEFIEETSVTEEDWFEFGWMLNQYLGTLKGDIIPLVDFNYLEVERVAENYVEENAPVTWESILEHTTQHVETANSEQISRWLDLANITENEDREITDMNFRCGS